MNPINKQVANQGRSRFLGRKYDAGIPMTSYQMNKLLSARTLSKSVPEMDYSNLRPNTKFITPDPRQLNPNPTPTNSEQVANQGRSRFLGRKYDAGMPMTSYQMNKLLSARTPSKSVPEMDYSNLRPNTTFITPDTRQLNPNYKYRQKSEQVITPFSVQEESLVRTPNYNPNRRTEVPQYLRREQDPIIVKNASETSTPPTVYNMGDDDVFFGANSDIGYDDILNPRAEAKELSEAYLRPRQYQQEIPQQNQNPTPTNNEAKELSEAYLRPRQYQQEIPQQNQNPTPTNNEADNYNDLLMGLAGAGSLVALPLYYLPQESKKDQYQK